MMFWWFVLLQAVLTKQERLIPWIPEQVITLVDVVNKRLTVDWDIDF
jgi:ribosomal 30S subunit maturation factor RimM